MEAAQSLYDRILDLLPDGVVAVDRELFVLQLNRAACRMLGLPDAAGLLGRPVCLVMDDTPFRDLRDGDEAPPTDFGQKGLERSFFCDEERSVFVCLLREVRSERAAAVTPAGQRRAAELAEQIGEKQLRIVHEIAGLLGEAAVETQGAVRELKLALLPGKEAEHD